MISNKFFQATLSTAVLTALLVGCQPSDKQKTQIRRGGGAGSANKAGGDLSGAAQMKTPNDVTPEKAQQDFEAVAEISKSKLLVEQLADGDYILIRILFDVQANASANTKTPAAASYPANAATRTRANLVASLDGSTICSGTAQPQPQSKATNVRTQSTSTVCNNNSIRLDIVNNAGTSAGMVNLPGENTTNVNSYLRFSVVNKQISINPKDAVNVKAGMVAGKGMGLELGPVNGTQSVFTFITAGQENAVDNGLYVMKKPSTTNDMSVAIRQITDGALSITYENIRKAPNMQGRVDQFVFQYKKVSRTAEKANTDTSTAAAGGTVPALTDPKTETKVDDAAFKVSDTDSK